VMLAVISDEIDHSFWICFDEDFLFEGALFHNAIIHT
jgi:hypothetical protein